MRYELPNGHGLPPRFIESKFVNGPDGIQLTSVQYDALAARVAAGRGMVVSAPTSSGKTGVGIFAITGWLSSRQAGSVHAVYLASHKALAKEKFREFQRDLLPLLELLPEQILLATGDGVEDGNGDVSAEPLGAPIVIATYEKYLGLLASTGLPNDMTNTCVVLDELQIIGDVARGQDIEVLITLLRQARCGQIVGLSAVLDSIDLTDIAHWLGIHHLRTEEREVDLTYELRTQDRIVTVSTGRSDSFTEQTGKPALSTESVLQELLREGLGPVVVFCTRRQDVFSLSKSWNALTAPPGATQGILPFGEETTSGRELNAFIPKSFAFHTADLTEEEREAVEDALRRGSLQVVFATTTLAFGLNFSFRTVIIHDWQRYNFDRRRREPISFAEFHNMAGRAGRLSLQQDGRVIFFAKNAMDVSAARAYLQIGDVNRLPSCIDSERFDQITLQLLGAGIATTEANLRIFLSETLSATRERDRNLQLDAIWARAITDSLARLRNWGFVNSRLRLTRVGRRVSSSGLHPQSACELLEYLSAKLDQLIALVAVQDGTSQSAEETEDLAFALIFACFGTRDFDKRTGGKRTLPWQIDGRRDSERGERLGDYLSHTPWHERAPDANGADAACDWIAGMPLRDLEERFSDLRSGSLRAMFNDVAQMLHGWADVAYEVTAPSLPAYERLPIFPDPDRVRDAVRLLIGHMRRLAHRLEVGLPEDLIWTSALQEAGRPFLKRRDALALLNAGMSRASDILDEGRTHDLIATVKNIAGSEIARFVQRLRTAVRQYRVAQSQRLHESQVNRLGGDWPDVIGRVYNAPGTQFEDALNEIFERVGIKVLERDTQNGKPSFPDFVLYLPNIGHVVLECKARQPQNTVDLDLATDVIRKAAVNGYHDCYKVTVCRPYLSTDVPRKLGNCQRLAIVNAEDITEVLVRVALGRSTLDAMADWLSQPGHITLESFTAVRAQRGDNPGNIEAGQD